MNNTNYERYSNDVMYEMDIPPYGLNFQSMTAKQAKENFLWFTSVVPKRMSYFIQRCSTDLNISPNALDYSAKSLKMVWKWFLNTYKTEKTPKDELAKQIEASKIFGDSYINYECFSVATTFIIFDISIYVGQCFVTNHSSLSWDYYTKPKSDVFVNQPIISGFQVNINGCLYPDTFPPMHMTSIRAAKVFNNTQSISDLYDIFVKWEKNIIH